MRSPPARRSYDVSHIHAIFNHKGENLLKTEKVSLEYSDKNEYTHLYTLHIKPDGTYEIFFDLESKASGKLVDDWAFPKPTIDDPDDKKPSDWVDETEIDDPEDKKPDGYDDIPAQARFAAVSQPCPALPPFPRGSMPLARARPPRPASGCGLEPRRPTLGRTRSPDALRARTDARPAAAPAWTCADRRPRRD